MRKAIVGVMTLVTGFAAAVEPVGASGVNTAAAAAATKCETRKNTASSAVPCAAPAVSIAAAPAAPFEAFTGKIGRSKVRLRSQPNVDSEIIRELGRHEMLLIVGEHGDFYAVQAPSNIKAYVFRTFILENTVEGRRVNVRLKPDTESPVIAQLNAGDKVKGTVCAGNGKWMEIDPPASVKFYVAKEFVERAGDAHYLARIEKQRDDANRQLSTLSLMSQSELRKPFDESNVDSIVASLDKLIGSNIECAVEIERAKELKQLVKDAYTQKRISHLEAKAHTQDRSLSQKNAELASQIESYQSKLRDLEHKLIQPAVATAAEESSETKSASVAVNATPTEKSAQTIAAVEEKTILPNSTSRNTLMTDKMAVWEPVEQAYFEEWIHDQNQDGSWAEFYSAESARGIPLKGIVEPYSKPIKNKPGDYVLVNQENKIPIAFIYSTKLNLQELIGQEVTVVGIPRPNNNFAYPAYYALSAN